MVLKQFGTHYELWLNEISDKPTIISEGGIENFINTMESLDLEVPVLIMAPSGIAGANIKEMNTMSKNEAKEFAELGNKMIQKLLYYKPIVIGFFDIFLLGGGLEFALACDIVVTTENCKIGFPESTLGIIPGFFGIDLVYKRNNPKLYELLYSGEVQKAEKTKNNMFFNDMSSTWEGLMIRKNRYLEQYRNVSYKSLSKIKERILNLKNYNTFNISSDIFSEMFEEVEQIERMQKFLKR